MKYSRRQRHRRFRHHGYRVLEASSGDVGIELAKQHLPDLILTDISMPGSDGQAVLWLIHLSGSVPGKSS